jgi:4-amino-4-deoxy-L-arabinose transferase-like glycosyltransferase
MWWLAGIVAFGTALRLAHVLALRATPWFDQLVVDPEYYDAWARSIAAGDWMGTRAFYMDPLYPYVLAVVYRLCGRDLLLARLLNIGCSAGSCTLVGVLGRRLGGSAACLIAALGFALYEPDIFFVGEIDKTSLSIMLTAATLVLAVGSSRRARFGAGVMIALASLTRANVLLFAPFVALTWLLRRAGGSLRRRVAGVLLFAAGVLVVLLPVAWRNHHVSGAWVLTTSQAGQNFYTGNNPYNPSGSYGALPFIRGNPHFEETDFRAAAEARVGRSLAPAEVSRFWFSEAFAHIREHPAFALRTFFRKAALFWNDFEISDNQDQYLLEDVSWVLGLPLLGFGWIAPLALLGAIAFRDRYEVRLLSGFVLIYWATLVAFFVFSRYRIQAVPALLPLAALGVVDLSARLRARAWTPIATAAAILLASAVFCFHTIDVFSRDNEQVVEMRLRHRAQMELTAGHPDKAIATYQEALQRCPLRCPEALEELITTYENVGRHTDAERYLRQFIQSHPQHPTANSLRDRLESAAH